MLRKNKRYIVSIPQPRRTDKDAFLASLPCSLGICHRAPELDRRKNGRSGVSPGVVGCQLGCRFGGVSRLYRRCVLQGWEGRRVCLTLRERQEVIQ